MEIVKKGRKTHIFTGPQFIWDLAEKYGFEACGVIQPIALFPFGRMDGNYDGDAVLVTINKKPTAPTFEEYYFPAPQERIRLTASNTDEEISVVIKMLQGEAK